MKNLLSFFKLTALGGLLVLLPIYSFVKTLGSGLVGAEKKAISNRHSSMPEMVRVKSSIWSKNKKIEDLQHALRMPPPDLPARSRSLPRIG